MTVSDAERVAMARLLKIMDGDTHTSHVSPITTHAQEPSPVELAGAGQVTSRDIQAMAQVLQKFNQAVHVTHEELIRESAHDKKVAEALITERESHAVRVGSYKISVRMDEHRVAGRQYYDVIHTRTGECLAHELSLYEAAHGLVRMLNSGKYVNDSKVRELLEAEAAYTSHRIDALHYHKLWRRAQQKQDLTKQDVYEARKMASLDRAAQAKAKVKKLYNQT